jgi:outer membrane protein assembly factor BamB
MGRRGLLIALVTISLAIGLAGPRLAYAAGGDEIWAERYDGPAHQWDAFTQLAMSPDGSAVFITGESYSYDTSYDIETIAYDPASGAELWASRFDPVPGRAESPTDLVVSPDGQRLFVTGRTYFTGDPDQLLVFAYDAKTGALLWSRLLGDPEDAYSGQAIAVSPDGDVVFVTGTANRPDDNVNVITLAYDAADGATRWIRFFDGPDHDYDVAEAIQISPDGSQLFVVGFAGPINVDTDWLVLSYVPSSGRRLWVNRIDGPGHAVDIPFSAAVRHQGDRLFVSGFVTVQDHERGATMGLDTESGAVVWQRTMVGLADGFGWTHGVIASPDGSRVYVTGDLPGVNMVDTMVTAAYDAWTGNQVWTEPYVGPFGDGAFGADLVVSPDGRRLYVAGTEYGPDSDDYATVAYVAGTGRRLWSARYDGPTHLEDEASSVAVSPDGSRVFVTGNSVGTVWPDYDFATVAYGA